MFNNPILIMEITVVYRCFLLLLLCICLHCKGCMVEERDALLQIKTSINSPEGTIFSNWYGKDCCQWYGVECNSSTTRVSRIFFHYLRDQNLFENWYPNATLFALLKDLENLELPGNRIEGFTSPDELQKLKNLQKLDLRDNLIENASHLCWGKGALPSLYSLDLSKNQLNLIPECLCDSLPLTELFLSDNNLQGNISCLNKPTSLELLDLSNNKFKGSFPSFLVLNLTRIEVLILSRNQFKGKVSFSIFTNLSRIRHLDISYNAHLELDTEPQTWFPSFNINVLNLADCNLRKIPSFLSSQNNLKSLDLSDNYLSGPFPKIFRNISSQLTLLDISNNSFHGHLPEDINSIFPELLLLDASYNGFHGGIPPSFGRLKLHSLDLSVNKLDGEIPYLMTSNMSSPVYLHLQENNLRGDAVTKNSSLPKLVLLDLGKNDLTGIFLDSLLWSLSQSPALSQLRILILRENRLKGKIPQQLCRMRRLHLLDLSQNNLSGDIPDCMDNITSWTAVEKDAKKISTGAYVIYFFSGLDLSCNRLTGSIPIQIANLKAISFLNMSNNLLTGQIPVSLANLEALEALDLSHNKFFGKLCQELTTLHFLSYFNVSFNNLSGAIPITAQFATFNEASYLGNPRLCGIPLKRGCSVDTEKPSYAMSSQIWPSPTICYFLALFLFFL